MNTSSFGDGGFFAGDACKRTCSECLAVIADMIHMCCFSKSVFGKITMMMNTNTVQMSWNHDLGPSKWWYVWDDHHNYKHCSQKNTFEQLSKNPVVTNCLRIEATARGATKNLFYSNQSTRELTYPHVSRHLRGTMIFTTSRLVGMIYVSLPNRRYPPTSKLSCTKGWRSQLESKTRKFDALMGESSLKEVIISCHTK